MTSLARRASDWFCGDADLHSMVLMRILLGLVVFVFYASLLPEMDRTFGPHGMAGADFAAAYAEHGTPFRPYLGNQPDAFYALQLVSSSGLIRGLYGLLLVSALAFTLGAATRVSGTIVLVLHVLFHARNPYAYWGWAVMLKPLLLYAVLAQSGRWCSLDARRRRGRENGRDASGAWLGPAWPLRLTQIHVMLMYAAQWPRLESANWLGGRMLFAALTNRNFGRLDVDWVTFQELLMVACIAALVLEVSAPILIWIRGVGKWVALALIGFHLILEVSSTVGWWNFVMIAGIVNFLPVAWLRPVLGDRAAGSG